jgi:hypothetical protein
MGLILDCVTMPSVGLALPMSDFSTGFNISSLS